MELFAQVTEEGSSQVKLSPRDFSRLSEFISATIGVKMPEAKKTLLESRLGKRLRALGFKSFGEYCDYLFSPEGARSEPVQMIDLVVTNKTDFFREAHHFDFLASVLPELMKSGAGVDRTLMVWSAGCSTGEEPYTLAMALSEFALRNSGFDYRVLATDISTRVLTRAARGVYEEDRACAIPVEYRRKYLLRSRDKEKRLIKVTPELGSRITFRRLNLMDEDYGFREQMDVIFCRNVIIYFNRETQEKLFRKFSERLSPGGYIFIGHSETLNGFTLPLEKVAPTVYRKV